MKRGFTLAEVLITLGIIGVVAALTIPILMQKIDERETVSKLTKSYSTLSRAWNMMQNEYGTIDKWGLTKSDSYDEDGNLSVDPTSQSLVGSRLKQYLKIIKECRANEVCDERVQYNLNGIAGGNNLKVDADNQAFVLSDGSIVKIGWYSPEISNIYLMVSLNTDKTKRVLGKTDFFFRAGKKGLFPEGDQVEPLIPFDVYCKPDNSGRGCAAWVIYNKNLDYLHCREELSWDGKTSCK